MIDIVLTLTESEYLEAQRLHMRERIRRGRIRRTISLCILFTGLFVFFWKTTGPRDAVLITLPTVSGTIVLALGLRKILHTWIFRKRFKTDSRLLTNVHLTIDDLGTHGETVGIGHGTLEWTAFTNWLEGKQSFVLFIGCLFRAIPKRLLSEQETAHLRSLLEQKIGPEGVARKI